MAFDRWYFSYFNKTNKNISKSLLRLRVCFQPLADVFALFCSWTWRWSCFHDKWRLPHAFLFAFSQTLLVQRCKEVFWQWHRSPGGSNDSASSRPGLCHVTHYTRILQIKAMWSWKQWAWTCSAVLVSYFVLNRSTASEGCNLFCL